MPNYSNTEGIVSFFNISLPTLKRFLHVASKLDYGAIHLHKILIDDIEEDEEQIYGWFPFTSEGLERFKYSFDEYIDRLNVICEEQGITPFTPEELDQFYIEFDYIDTNHYDSFLEEGLLNITFTVKNDRIHTSQTLDGEKESAYQASQLNRVTNRTDYVWIDTKFQALGILKLLEDKSFVQGHQPDNQIIRIDFAEKVDRISIAMDKAKTHQHVSYLISNLLGNYPQTISELIGKINELMTLNHVKERIETFNNQIIGGSVHD